MGKRREGKRDRRNRRGRGRWDGREFDYAWNPFPNIDADDREIDRIVRSYSDPGPSFIRDPDSLDMADENDEEDEGLVLELVSDPLLRRYRRY
jgi:hypothetical protein